MKGRPTSPRRRDRFGRRVGKVTHPSAAPDNHLLTVWSPGPVNGGYTVHVPAVDSGLYLIKDGKPIDEPGQMLLIKNDPRYNEQWPRALVPYQRIYGIAEPKPIAPLGQRRQAVAAPSGGNAVWPGRHLQPVQARELSQRRGAARQRDGDASPADRTRRAGSRISTRSIPALAASRSNWINQGADAGRYSNDDIHAVRILAMEPTTDRQRGPKSGRTFRSHANERLRILGEIPVRKFPHCDRQRTGQDGQPIDPDGNPDTSFLAKIPADIAFTFQTLDRDGMVLNMAQTWHQLRPGEIRNDCGGCHAHSQKPTLFREHSGGEARLPDLRPDRTTPLLTTQARRSVRQALGQRRQDRPALRQDGQERRVLSRRQADPRPQLRRLPYAEERRSRPAIWCWTTTRSSICPTPTMYPAPTTAWRWTTPAASAGQPLIGSWRNPNASRYVRMFQSRRSLLIWKVLGTAHRRLDQRRFPDRDSPRRSAHAQTEGQSRREHAGQPQSGRPRLHRQHHAAARGRCRRVCRPRRQEDQGRGPLR